MLINNFNFLLYFLSFVVSIFLTNSFLDTKKNSILYSEIKDLEKTTGDKLILTNTQQIIFQTN